MSDPIAFDNTTPRLGLPLLFAAQAQKEVYVNEAFAILDGLLHGAIEGIQASAPTSPGDGANWLVDMSPTGEWSGQAGQIACRQAGNWLFVAPRDGMVLLNRGNGQFLHYNGTWKMAAAPAAPSGGSTVDDVARTAIVAIITALKTAGIFADS